MIWTAKMNCALSSRNSTESDSITTTRLSTERIGWWNATTPMPPRTAIAAATKKTAIAKLGFLPLPSGERVGERGVAMQPRFDVGRQRLEQLLLGVDELFPARVGKLVLRPEHDRLHRARVLAVAAEDAAQHVDLIRLGVALARRDSVLVGVLGRDHEDAAHRAGSGAQLAADAALEPVVVAAEIVTAPIALGARGLVLRIHRGDGGPKRLGESRFEAREQSAHVPSDARLFRGFRLFVAHPFIPAPRPGWSRSRSRLPSPAAAGPSSPGA